MNCSAPQVVSIRKFIPEVDSAWLHDLWHRTMHGRWAISMRAMLNIISKAALVLVAECEGLQSAVCAVDSDRGSVAGLILLLVEPACQRRGVGTESMRKVEKRLREQGVQKLVLGAGNGDYFWPGLPQEQNQAWPFFRKLGFLEEESSEDLIQVLHEFKTPGWVSTRLATSGITLCLAEPANKEQIAEFENKYFPAWTVYFENEMSQGDYRNILLAEGSDGSIVGTILLKREISIPWMEVHGKRFGTLNTLGVAPQRQGQGIGLALTAGAMEHLEKRGCTHCFVQWTGLAKWYGKLGAKRWAHYHMVSKIL